MEIAERDRMDMSRKVAPLTRAEDAVLIDTSDFSIGQVAEMIIKAVNSEN
jgi:cytidylate kinase